jgi:hypothetical protein
MERPLLTPSSSLLLLPPSKHASMHTQAQKRVRGTTHASSLLLIIIPDCERVSTAT